MLQRRTATNGVVFYASPLLEQAGVPHAFSTRLGGVSPAPFDSLNLGNPSGCDQQDDHERIYENYDRLQSAAELHARERCWVHQVHGGQLATIWRGEPFESGVKADAILGDADEFFSHRRDRGVTGRMAALISPPLLPAASS